ncbi:MAG: alpha/beta hydrolase [Christensenellales bacterium]|jgi:dienelactone hydrolase
MSILMPKAQQESLRKEISDMLGIPKKTVDLAPEHRGSLSHDGLIIEKWVFTAEEGSKVPCILYRPEGAQKPMPAVVITNGHGGSKNSLYILYTAQLYAKMGLACLVYDTIGEEERHLNGEKGTRAHDDSCADKAASDSGRIMLGKMIFDTMRALDFLEAREDIDKTRLGVVGNSLGGAVSAWMTALEGRLHSAIVSGFILGEYSRKYGKACTRIPSLKLEPICSDEDFIRLHMPHCAVLYMNGEKDAVMDPDGDGLYCRTIRKLAGENIRLEKLAGLPQRTGIYFDPEGGHRAYHNHKEALLWLHGEGMLPAASRRQIEEMPEITMEAWCLKHGFSWEAQSAKLYWVQVNHQGAKFADANIRPIPPEDLKCLRPDELGDDAYTLEGWLKAIS